MNKKIKNKELVSMVFFIIIVLIAILISFANYQKTHPDFDVTISGKEATVISEVAKIYYDDPFDGRNIATIKQSQTVELTGRMAYPLQSNLIKMEIRLEDNRFAWISKEDILISE